MNPTLNWLPQLEKEREKNKKKKKKEKEEKEEEKEKEKEEGKRESPPVALDVASGVGRDCIFLAMRGWEVGFFFFFFLFCYCYY